MTKRNFAVAALVVAAIVVAGGLYASNMGFKLNYVLVGKAVATPYGEDGAAVSSTGINTISLPYFSPFATAKPLIDDLNIADGNADIDFAGVARWDQPSDSLINYSGQTGTDYALNPGEGYFAQVNLANQGVTFNYIIVGSHDPGLTISFDTTGTGINAFAYPYHSTSANAKGLIDEVNAVVPGSIVGVARWDSASDSLLSYSGLTGTAFLLTPGNTYFVQVDLNVPNYVPSHY
jgi:hypothetical protein